MTWFLFRSPKHKVYVEAESSEEAITKATAAELPVGQPISQYDTLWEASARDRFCHFDGKWHNKPSKDKQYAKKYIRLEDHVRQPDVVVLGRYHEVEAD